MLAPPIASVTVESATLSHPVPASFLGLSLETWDLARYAGTPGKIRQSFVQLLRNLSSSNGQGPSLRLGGNSTDFSYWATPDAGSVASSGAFPLYQSWLDTISDLARKVNAPIIAGVNLADDNPINGSEWAKALQLALGSHLAGLEIGNEPEEYMTHSDQTAPDGSPEYIRPRGYTLNQYEEELQAYANLIGKASGSTIVGPASADNGFLAASANVLSTLRVAGAPVGDVTAHAYPFAGCRAVTDPRYPTISNLLGDSSSAGLAASLLPAIHAARDQGLGLRVDEINSAWCGGAQGVSDSWAATVWGVDTMFELLSAGVSGVNFHGTSSSIYAPIHFVPSANGRSLSLGPLYYAMLQFAQAAPAGSHLAKTVVTGEQSPIVKAWATKDSAGIVRVLLLDKDVKASGEVAVQVPPELHIANQRLLNTRGIGSQFVAYMAGQQVDPSSGLLTGNVVDTLLPISQEQVRVNVQPRQIVELTLHN